MIRTLLSLALLLPSCVTGREHIAAADPQLPFSNGVLVGDTFYVAGHLGLDKDTGQAPTDPKVEAGLLLDSFAATLAEVGMDMDDLVRVQLFCSDVGLYQTFNDVYRQRFKGTFPARAFIGSGKLLRGCRFEILGTAVRR